MTTPLTDNPPYNPNCAMCQATWFPSFGIGCTHEEPTPTLQDLMVVHAQTLNGRISDGCLTDQSQIWQALYLLTRTVVEAYHGDYYHDAVWLARHTHMAERQTQMEFWYAVGANGTHIFDNRGDAAYAQQHGRQWVYHVTITRKDDSTPRFALTICQIATGE